MSRLSLSFLLFVLLAWPTATPATAATAAEPLDAEATYRALRELAPDGRSLPVAGLVLERDALRFRFDRGTFHFLGPVAGRTVGAVFLGTGRFELHPAVEHERRHLALLTGTERLEVLRADLSELVLLFADDTLAELERHGTVSPGSPDPAAVAAYQRFTRRQRDKVEVNVELRLLQDLLEAPETRAGVFVAGFDTRELPNALAGLDPRGAGALLRIALLGGEDCFLQVSDDTRGGLWYLAPSAARTQAAQATGAPVGELRPADALHYTIDTRVTGGETLEGTTVVRLRALLPGLRVLPVELAPTLRISRAEYRLAGSGDAGAPDGAAWQPAAYVQEHEDADADAAVLLPRSVERGAEVEVRLVYAGDRVLRDVGDRNFVVGARTSWYPNLGIFSDPATFELTYRVPEGNEVVSVGRRVASATEAGQSVSTWREDHPIRVAGFNYGKFKTQSSEDPDTGVAIQVFTNPGTPDVIREINSALQANRQQISASAADPDNPFGPVAFDVAGPSLRIDTGKLAEAALADATNAARVGTLYFGPLAVPRVAITQQSEWSFGQSWPSLVFLPYVSFLHGGLRGQLGLAGGGIEDFLDQIGFHELSHQWWGHQVGWSSYRDQWLSEGFAEFTAALVLQHTQGWDAYRNHWQRTRERLLERGHQSAVPNYQAGPITQGWRLANHRTPGAYQALVYGKGGYVLHMLRMMMSQPDQPDPDAAFRAMMHDFVSSYSGESATTADFQRVVERHMLPVMNAAGNGTMDWFFDQWVDGTELPRYEVDLTAAKAGRGRYRISGRVAQRDVSAEFRAMVPVYADLGKGRLLHIAKLPMIGEMSRDLDFEIELPDKPRKILLNGNHEVLAKE